MHNSEPKSRHTKFSIAMTIFSSNANAATINKTSSNDIMVLKRALVVAFLLFLHAYATIDNLPALIKQTKPAIVSIYVYNKGAELIEGGSGFFISEDVIVSSRHVFWKQKKIPEAFSARVRTNDRDNPVVYTIKSIIHDDVDTDLILLKVDTEGYSQPYLTLADEVPDEGEEVFVVSSPEGLEGVVSTGIISAHHNEIDMQISCPISSGSSGAPVMNKRGEVVGIVNGYFTVGQLINFAINVRRLEMLVLDVDHTKNNKWPTLPEWTATHSTMIPPNNNVSTALSSSLWSPLRWWAGVANFTKAIFGTSKTVTPMPDPTTSSTASNSKTKTSSTPTTTPATSPIDDPLVRSRRETCAK